MSNDPFIGPPNFQNWTIGHLILTIIVVAAAIGILLIALRVFGIPVPEWAWQMAAIAIVATVACVLVRWLFGMR